MCDSGYVFGGKSVSHRFSSSVKTTFHSDRVRTWHLAVNDVLDQADNLIGVDAASAFTAAAFPTLRTVATVATGQG